MHREVHLQGPRRPPRRQTPLVGHRDGAPIGAFSADWNATHVFNPKWTPHAKFHNAQTITLSVVTAGLTLWQLWRHWCRFTLPVVAGSYALERRRLGVGRAGRGR